MPHLIIRTIDSAFETADGGAEYPDVETAYRTAVRAAVEIAAGEVHGDQNPSMIEICVEEPDGKRVARGIVSLATSPLDNS